MAEVGMFPFLFASVFTTLGAISDIRTRKIPNKLTVPVFALGVLFHAIGGAWSGGLAGLIGNWQGSENLGNGLLFSLCGFGTGFGILFILFAIGGGGGGDVKMMGALGSWIGARLMLWVFLLTAVFAIIGSLFVIVQVITTGGFSGFRKKLKTKSAKERRLLTYGVPAACATWTVFAFQWVQQLGAVT